MLPQEFIDDFNDAGLDINSPQFGRCVPKNCHRLKSGNGMHTNQNGKGTHYNALWAKFLNGLPQPITPADAPAIMNFLGQMAVRFAKQLICAGK